MGLLSRIKSLVRLCIYRFTKPRLLIIEALLSGDGSFVDVRYWISRPDKLNPSGAVYLVDEQSGKRLYLMSAATFGAMRTRHNKRKTSGALLFYNKDKLVTSGATVSLYLDTLTAVAEVK